MGEMKAAWTWGYNFMSPPSPDNLPQHLEELSDWAELAQELSNDDDATARRMVESICEDLSVALEGLSQSLRNGTPSKWERNDDAPSAADIALVGRRIMRDGGCDSAERLVLTLLDALARRAEEVAAP